ncbi:Cof-type HAD-IIB family hydrolase [Dongshaea marina]|uniref:Cof-type HAD-IIB family hydrolase n=1 Tax=Dongshaea marina TaxID=2047966 RepID=UPI000D3ED8D5|nr:Cof-type HAD-IIB family hydrolase [Dongshaea marina]
MYKVVVSDLDGTLFNQAHQISPYTRQVIHQLLDQGYKFILATGRHHQDVQKIRSQLGIDCFLITSNGAMVHDKQDNLIHTQSIEPKLVAKLLEIERPTGVHANIYRGDEWFVEQESPDLLEFHPDSAFSYQLCDFRSLDKEGTTKLFFSGSHEELLALEKVFEAQLGDKLHIAFSLPTCLEVMAKGVNKGSALEAVLKVKGFKAEQSVAFGDGMNDYEMLKTAGLGVVMSNAHDRLKQQLPEHPRAGSNDDDGVAHFLNELLFNQQQQQSA